jgi:hypothetical protein
MSVCRREARIWWRTLSRNIRPARHPEVEFRGWQGAGEEFVVEARQRVESEKSYKSS